MSILRDQYKQKAPSKLIKCFDSGEHWEEAVYCKPAAKRSYAFWIADMAQFDDLQENDVKQALGSFCELMAKLVCLCACDEDGVATLDYNTDVDWLCELDDPTILETMFQSACDANGITELGKDFVNAFAQIDTAFDGLSDYNKKGAAKSKAKKSVK